MQSSIVRIFLTNFLVCLTLAKGSAQSAITLNVQKNYRVDKYCSVFLDTSNQLTIDEVVSLGRFEARSENLTFGYLKSAIWLKIQANQHDSKESSWLLNIPAPFLEFVDFYQKNENGNLIHSQSGYYRPFSQRNLWHTGHVLPLIFNNEQTTVYIKIAGASPKTFPVYITEEKHFNEITRWEDLGYGVFFGILIVMFFYNLFIYLTLKQVNYLLYICTIVCTFLIFASASGYAGKFLWPEHPYLNFYAGRLTLPVLTTFLAIFTIRFLEVREYSKVMYYALVALIPLSLVAVTLIVSGILPSAGNNLVSLSTFIYIASGIVCRVKGNKNANYFIAAWTIYMVGGLLLTLRNSGVLDFNTLTTHFVEVGAALETIIIAFALADHYRRLKQEKEAAQFHALKLQLGENERLELKVRQRTEELSKSNYELQETLEKNRQQTQIIENKNAELDAFFHRVSHDLKGPISSLLGLASLAKIEVKDALATQYLEKQQQQIERLNQIISGLIKLTRLQGEIVKQPIDFHQLIDDCIASLETVSNFEKIRFKKEISNNLHFDSEWTLLNAIVQNLIENSIKYSNGKDPFVAIRIFENSSGQSLMIEVSDNGHGIAAEHQPKIFDIFYRATVSNQGSGLGLYILKRSVDRLNGRVEIESQEGVGSTFRVILPK